LIIPLRQTYNILPQVGENVVLSITTVQVLFIHYHNGMVVKSFLLLLFLHYSVAYNDEWATTRQNKYSVQKHGDTTDLQSYIFTYGIQIRLPCDLEKNIYTTVSISFLFEWYDGVFQMKLHGIRLILKWWLTSWECSSNGRIGIAKFPNCQNDIAPDDISRQKICFNICISPEAAF
jgi:hypothetical protein